MKKSSYIRWFSVICILGLLLSGLCVMSAYAEQNGGMILLRRETLEAASIQTRQIIVKSNQFISLGIENCEADCNCQWQYLPSDGKEWQDWEGRTGTSLYEMVYDEMDGWMLRCSVTQKGKTEWTETASLEVRPTILDIRMDGISGFSQSIKDVTAEIKKDEGEVISLWVTCSRNDVSLQWYTSKDHENWMALDGKTEKKITITLTADMNDTYLNCVMKDERGRSDSLWDICKKPELCLHIFVIPGKTDYEETIYALDNYYEDKIRIPDNLSGEIDLKGEKCSQIDGESAKVENGAIVPVKLTWKDVDTDEVSEEHVFGDTVFTLENGKRIRVHVVNYAKVYAQNVMNDYLAKHITSGMTERQKAEICCEFVCRYNYSTEASGYTGMILMGGGDCWASTDTLLYMLREIGILAEPHDSRGIDGGGSGHYNVSAILDGIYCIVEAGYDMEPPRRYSIYESKTAFHYGRNADSQDIWIGALINPDKNSEIVIPSTIDGYTVYGLSEAAFRSHSEITSVILPDTLKKIGNYVFSGTGIRSLTLPASLNELSEFALVDCDLLEKIDVVEGNSAFSSKDGILYSKDGKTLICCPAQKSGDLIIPEGVEKINKWAFEGVRLESLTLPASLRQTDTGTFYDTFFRKLVFAEGTETIPDDIFFRTAINSVVLPQSLTKIGNNVFRYSHLQAVNLPERLDYIGDEAFLSTNLQRVTIPASVKKIGNKAFHLTKHKIGYYDYNGLILFTKDQGEIEFGEDIFDNAVLGVYEGSAAHLYAEKNKVPFVLLDENGKIPLKKEWFYAYATSEAWTGEPIHPTWFQINHFAIPTDMNEGIDYIIEWGENRDPGTGTIKVTGQGLFTGSLDFTFEIIGGPTPEPTPEPTPTPSPEPTTEPTPGPTPTLSPKPTDEPKPTPEPEPADQVEAYIYRCYKVILGRLPDAGGLKTWYNELTSGRKTASEIIDRFVNSPEYINKHYNYGDSVDILYQAMLGRNADEAGKANWVKKLESGQTLAHVINGFCFSREFRGLCDNYGIRAGFVNIPNTDTTAEGKIKAFVQRCYRIILDREADPSGMQTWYEQLSSGKKAAAEIIDRFVNSPEFSGKRYSHSDSVEILYKAMLGRGSDAAGKANWVSKLDAGQPFAVVINGFCVSKEFTGICASYGIKPGNVNIRLSAQSEEELSMLALNAKAPITRRSETKPNRVEIINPSDTIDMNIGTAVQAVYINDEKAKEFIGRCYRVILGREASEAEVETWIGQMVNGTKTPDQIARGFLFSNEFKAKNVSSEELVKILYRVYMNRDADPEGLATWTQKLDEGTGLNDLLDVFAKTNEFKAVLKDMAQ